MQSAEDVALTFADGWPMSDGALTALTDLIRERDAQVRDAERAKVLAGFTEERKDRRSCGCRVPVNAVWSCCYGAGHTVATERRLIGPWEPTS